MRDTAGDTCGNFKKYDVKTREPVGAALLSGRFGDPMGIIAAEIFYPAGYSTANSEISDLGATSPPDSIIYQPSASIFNTTMIIGGLLVLGASFFLFREYKRWTLVLFPMLLGIGVLGSAYSWEIWLRSMVFLRLLHSSPEACLQSFQPGLYPFPSATY